MNRRDAETQRNREICEISREARNNLHPPWRMTLVNSISLCLCVSAVQLLLL